LHHSYLDKYARRDSSLHRLDARTKLPLFGGLVILISVVPAPGVYFFLTLVTLICLFCYTAKIPAGYLLMRSAIIIPFTGFAAVSYALTISYGDVLWQWGPFELTTGGIHKSVILLLRAWLAVSLMILLVNTTPFDRLLASLRSFRVPPLFVLLLSFFYRYLYLLWDEGERMQRARNLRYFGGRWTAQVPILGRMVSTLFLRSYQRAERVQMAMLSRGWDGEVRVVRSQPLRNRDKLVLLVGVLLILLLWTIRNL